MKEILLSIALCLLLGCKTSPTISTITQKDTSPFYGTFSQNTINWYLEMEESIGSKISEDKISYIRLTYQAMSEKFWRTQPSKFQPSPIVSYVYDNDTKKIMEIHYEWDIINSLPKEEKYDIRIESKTRSDEFVSYFETLSSIINTELGERIRDGAVTMDSTLDYEFIELTDRWKSEKLQCELYMIFSNHHEKRGAIEIRPSHRIRCAFKWSD
jgi:hypothetical protein